MPKKRKTRKQKISIDQKRQVVNEVLPSMDSSIGNEASPTQQETITQPMTFSLPTHFHPNQTSQKEKKVSKEPLVISTANYGYLAVDLMRTALLSGAIVIAEILIKIFFRG